MQLLAWWGNSSTIPTSFFSSWACSALRVFWRLDKFIGLHELSRPFNAGFDG